MASAGRIIREVVCWNRSVFSKVSLVVSLEILNKSNQTNNIPIKVTSSINLKKTVAVKFSKRPSFYQQ